MKKFAIGIGVLMIGALVGCSSNTPSNTPVQPVPGATQNSVEQTGNQEILTEEAVTQIINQEVPGGKILKVEKDLEDIVPHYDFKLVKDNIEYEIEVNAYDGSIRGIEKEVATPNTNTVDETLLIGEAKAGEIAHAQVPEGEIIGIEYENDESVPKYDVSMRDEKYDYDFEIDALTGEILTSEKELLNQ